MRYLLLLLLMILLVGCASVPLTEEQIEEKEYWEQERQIAYLQWRDSCISPDGANGVIYVYKPFKMCRGRNCIPNKWDWRYDFDRERPMLGNAYMCISRAQMREIMRNL